MDVTFNEKGIPIGKEVWHFISFLGMLVQSRVPVDIPNWHHVPSEMKDRFRAEVLVSNSLSYVLIVSITVM